MESHSLVQTSTALFTLAAGGGLLMAVMRFGGTPRPPHWLAMGHGFLAAAGLTLLLYAALVIGVPGQVQLAAGLFVAAALGGVALNLLYHAKQLALPVPLMVVHALVAASGLALLLVHQYG